MYVVLSHDRDMQRVTGRECRGPEHDVARAVQRFHRDRENLVDDAEESVERRLNRVAPVNRDVPMQDLLQHFHVDDQPSIVDREAFEEPLRVGLVRMRGADEVHRDVRIDQNHPR